MFAMVVFQQLCALFRTLLQRARHPHPKAPRREPGAYPSRLGALSVGTRLGRATELSIGGAPPGGQGATGAGYGRYSMSRFFGFRARCFSGRPHLQPPQDLVLFKHHRPGFFRLLALFCLGQGGFWAYLGQYGFSSLRDTGAAQGGNKVLVEEPPSVTSTWGKKLNLGSKLWRYGFTLTCFTVGSLIIATGFLFMQRSVSQVLLHQGGKLVTIWTSTPFGSGSYFTVPLQHISCMAHRSEVPSMIPIKIKGRPLYFMLDKQGQVFNGKLFDITIGAYRKL